ncbi:MAG: hypothetical protein HN560_11120 [Anaerolineae bacterium]|jgi:hypothetical protein|nr:hypothetical protein [Anaerolineae bacterium]MBT7601615.1 hypothetical protein [Anaerolineae bacterium]MBT7990976.1 hypothetical protein [Anaerolineae bacterium]
MGEEKLQEAIESIKEYIERDVKAGFMAPSEIVDHAIDVFYGEIDSELLKPDAEKILEKALSDHLAAQADWPEVTDCDRLDDTFAQLKESGIAAVQDAICCSTCAMEDVSAAIDTMRKEEMPVRGYTFFHEQDTEHAIQSGRFNLSYGYIERDQEAAIKIGHEVKEALEKNGFKVEWDGTIRKRITVFIDWQRRRQ